jgi:cytochrome c2
MKSRYMFISVIVLLGILVAGCASASNKMYSQDEVSAAFAKGACGSCHSIPGIPNAAGVIAPDLTNINAAAEEHFQGGGYSGTAKTSEEYIRESILDPGVRIAEGYGPIMPTYRGLISEEGILQIIEFLKTGGVPATAPAITSATI